MAAYLLLAVDVMWLGMECPSVEKYVALGCDLSQKKKGMMILFVCFSAGSSGQSNRFV
jgi:hypothetical protein